MNKKEILKRFKENKHLKTFLNPKKDLSFEIVNFNIDIQPKIQNTLSYDITTNKIKSYDKLKGLWFKTELALYVIVGGLK